MSLRYYFLQVINENLKTIMTEADVFAVVSKAQEFDQIKVKLKKINKNEL